MILQIPVSSFSKKILLKTEKEPIRISRFSIMHSCFTDIRWGKPERIEGAMHILNETLTFEINKRMPRNRQMYIYQAGLNVHRLHNYMMMTFIEGYIHDGRSASEGIRKYFDMYDIWYEDMDIENTFRQWQRHRAAKKNKIFSKKNVTKRLQKNTLNCQKTSMINLAVFHEELGEFLYLNLPAFTTKDKKFRYKLYYALKIFLMYRVLNYNAKNLSDIFGLSTRSIYRSIATIENIIKYDASLGPQIKEMIS